MSKARYALATSLLLLAACGGGGGGGNDDDNGGKQYQATVTRTSMGVPHIQAKDYASLGYGYGYAFAEDNLCTMLEDYVTIRGERAQYFGRAGSYSIPAADVTVGNVDSDFFWKLMATDAVVAELKTAARSEVQDITRGYVAGFNRYIAELKAGQHPGRHAACATTAYLAPISESDMYRRYYRLSIIASSTVFANEIATAQPPPLSGPDAAAPDAATVKAALAANPGPFAAFGRNKHLGSNMYGLGPQATQTGEAMLFGNPHFPWTGTERLYLAHLTVPGKMDIMGASLYGVPLVLIGFNNQLAWSHTVSTAYHFTLYYLPLNPLNPKQYYYEGAATDMTPVPLSVQVKESDGTTTTETRTLYRTQYGPIVKLSVSGIPVLGWDRGRAYTLRDANGENDRLMNQFFAWNTAGSLGEFKEDHATILGTPWVNTVAAGPGQNVYYGDLTVVPNTPDALVADCTPPIVGTLLASAAPGLPLLYGNRADCAWQNDADAPPGIFGREHLPKLERADWVANMNDSYWLTNPAAPITGFARIIGDEGTARTLRTRLGILQIQQRLAGSDGRAGTKFSYDDLKQIVLGSRIYSGELARDSVTRDLCARAPSACAALKTWDGKANLDSKGMHVWLEFWKNVNGIDNPWKVPFSIDDPVNTPNTLDTGKLAVGKALSDAQTAIGDAGLAFDAAWGDVQHSAVHGTPAPSVFGSEGSIGAFTVADSDGLTSSGYQVNYGNSYIQAVTWEGGKVHAEGFVTYSESTDPANPHFSDFTQRYTQKQWLRLPFSSDEIAADRQSSVDLSE
ncbi:penicillin acylase family protein [Solimonas soli]|uniref:penicillin acylase family protein n=1 Tax=Solimonas soli TaxID=413479 RepID=UPI000487EEC5|nr:penicillin acylase family protein [Solimonas soli]